MAFVKAKPGPANVGDSLNKFTVHYFGEQGNMIIRSGGSRAWRCNNPGALLKSTYSMSRDRRAIGSAGHGKYEYAVYPDYDTGHEALFVMLKGMSIDKTSMSLGSIILLKEEAFLNTLTHKGY